jgi:D-beta-D-heptose 7-phosphate kinase/D-beta-D-heptose 1-phosphate adenosyltransferase
MNAKKLSVARVRQILSAAERARVLVVGDVMLDQFIWGSVSRISPEAPVPVLDFTRESFMPGGAANVARNLVSLATPAELFGVIGQDDAARRLLGLLSEQNIGCDGLVKNSARHTSVKTRIVAHQQQVVRVDRETRGGLDGKTTTALLAEFQKKITGADAVIVGDYGKGVVVQPLLDEIKRTCHDRGIWLSVDPKPVHHLNLAGLSLITPNRKEAFELANLPDDTKNADPFADKNLLLVAERLLSELHPALLLVTLGELGMLLCRRFIFPPWPRKCSMSPARGIPLLPPLRWRLPPARRPWRPPFCPTTRQASSSAKSAPPSPRPPNCSPASRPDGGGCINRDIPGIPPLWKRPDQTRHTFGRARVPRPA